MLTMLSPERAVPQKHPLRKVKALADAALRELSPVFDEMYSSLGRPSIPPERLLKASLLIAFYSVRSETLFCEQLDYNLLFRWFLDMNLEEKSFVQETFSKNRERLMQHHVANAFFGKIVEQANAAGLMSDEHFTVDGTLIDAWASYAQHALMENRNGLLVDLSLTQANGTAEREAAIEMMQNYVAGEKRITVAGDKGFDTRGFVESVRQLNATPHVAQNITLKRRSAIDGRTTRHPGYEISQRIRKRVEDLWLDEDGGEFPEDAIQRPGPDGACLVPGRRGVQPSPYHQAPHAGRRMKPRAASPIRNEHRKRNIERTVAPHPRTHFFSDLLEDISPTQAATPQA